MAYYYVISKKVVKRGSANLTMPDVPDSISWVGIDGPGNTYLIKTSEPLPAGTSAQEKKPLPNQALQNACTDHGVSYEDVTNKWKV